VASGRWRGVRAFLRRSVEGCQRLEQLNHEYNLRASVQHGATIAAVSDTALADLRAGYEFMKASNLRPTSSTRCAESKYLDRSASTTSV
jgi:hypothetical protein